MTKSQEVNITKICERGASVIDIWHSLLQEVLTGEHDDDSAINKLANSQLKAYILRHNVNSNGVRILPVVTADTIDDKGNDKKTSSTSSSAAAAATTAEESIEDEDKPPLSPFSITKLQ